MELNTKARYAVMAMADLAKHGDEGAIPLSAIAERQNLSLAYLEQIFLRLRRAGLVASARGRAGGYVLVRPAPEIPVASILKAVEEETRMTRCLDGDVGCLGDQRCLTHGSVACARRTHRGVPCKRFAAGGARRHSRREARRAIGARARASESQLAAQEVAAAR